MGECAHAVVGLHVDGADGVEQHHDGKAFADGVADGTQDAVFGRQPTDEKARAASPA